MNRSKSLILLVLGLTCVGVLPAQGPPPPGGGPRPLPPVPVPPENPITTAKANLGKILFWDEQLSSNNTTSCATCHIPGTAGGDPRVGIHPGLDGVVGTPDDKAASPGMPRSDDQNRYIADPIFGVNLQVTERQAPSMINAAYLTSLFWDGRATQTFTDPETGAVVIANRGALESQAAGPPLSAAEMAHDNRDWSQITAKLQTAQPLRLGSNVPAALQNWLNLFPSYPALFQAAFGTSDITAARMAMAIATYERTLISNQTPYDRFLAGQTGALTANQQRGLQVFRTNGRCATCHREPVLSDSTFRNVGLRPINEDTGRFGVTGNLADRGRFRVPTLRNVGLRERFMHNGQFSTLREVIDFYARRGDFNQNIDPEMGRINLPPQDRGPLEDFLMNGLLDQRVLNETAPFDRPTLLSETIQRVVPLTTGGSIGSNGRVPRILTETPANVGNVDFRVGLGDVRGGEQAWLAVSASGAPFGTFIGGFPVGVDVLAPDFQLLAVPLIGTGATGGTATVQVPLPDDPGLVGATLHVQWLVSDGLAAAGAAVSPTARLTLF